MSVWQRKKIISTGPELKHVTDVVDHLRAKDQGHVWGESDEVKDESGHRPGDVMEEGIDGARDHCHDGKKDSNTFDSSRKWDAETTFFMTHFEVCSKTKIFFLTFILSFFLFRYTTQVTSWTNTIATPWHETRQKMSRSSHCKKVVRYFVRILLVSWWIFVKLF